MPAKFGVPAQTVPALQPAYASLESALEPPSKNR
jgi:hypothetical protein